MTKITRKLETLKELEPLHILRRRREKCVVWGLMNSQEGETFFCLRCPGLLIT